MHMIITCEHAGNKIPAEYNILFAGKDEILASHKSYDIGILPIAKQIGENAAFFSYNEISRLLIDFNRSPHSRNLFSFISKQLSQEQRQMVLCQYYYPYRQKIIDNISERIVDNSVLHICCHSFTPKFGNIIRQADIGLLYDSRNQSEKTFCLIWQQNIKAIDHALIIRRNYPYSGKADGLTTFLRKIFHQDKYLGIELEINQKLLVSKKSQNIALLLQESLHKTVFMYKQINAKSPEKL